MSVLTRYTTYTSLTAAALAVLGTLAGPTGAARVPANAPNVSPLVQAKTITVHEQFELFDSKTGKFEPFFGNVVLIRRAAPTKPAQIKVVVSQKNKPGSKPHLYVADGRTEHEYNALNNTYTTLDPHADGSSSSQLRDMSAIDLIMNGGPKSARKNVQRTVTMDMLDGHAMILTTDTHPSSLGSDGVTYRDSTKLWVDAATRLPYRWEFFITSSGKTTPEQELNFTDWALNTPLSPARLVWMPPAGSEPYSEPKMLAVGTPAPDFAALTPDGKTVHLSDFKGKTVVLDFWATWCGPCQRSMPHLEKVYQQVKDKDVAVLGVCVWDEKALYDKWVTANIGTKYNFPVAFDPAGRGKGNIAGSLYKVTGIPTQYVIDKEGKIAASTVGYDDGDTRLEANLNKLGVAIPVPPKTASAK